MKSILAASGTTFGEVRPSFCDCETLEKGTEYRAKELRGSGMAIHSDHEPIAGGRNVMDRALKLAVILTIILLAMRRDDGLCRCASWRRLAAAQAWGESA